MKKYLWVAAAALWAVSAGTASADVIGMYIGVTEGQTSILLEDGTWDYEQDWSYYIEEDGSADSFVNEHWISMDPLALIGNVDTDETDPNIDITKNITNDSGFDWTGFDITLSWDNIDSDVTLNEGSVASDSFDDVDITGGTLDGYYTMSFSGGSGIPDGGSGSFFFSFDILGDINFKIDQIPVPEPTSLGLLALGALALIRRR